MKVKLACYSSVMLIRGGPYVKLMQMRKHLKKLNVDVSFFNLDDSAEDIENCDLIHLFSANASMYQLAKNLKERNIPYVVNPIFFSRHSSFFVQTVSQMDRITCRMLPGLRWDYGYVRDICHWSKMVLPNTCAEAQLLTRSFGLPSNKVHVISNGVSDNFLHGDPTLFQKKYGIKNFILNVGHIGPSRKNTLALVRALQRLDHPAVIVGRIIPGGEGEKCLREAKKNPNLVVIDGLDHDSPMLASAYAACDVFVLPSTFETPGRAALEAALAGAKVVITPHGGTKEYFQDFAEYVNPYSVRSIRKGVERSLDSLKNNQLKNHIKEHYLWPVIAEQTVAVYQDLIQRSD